MQTHRQNRNYPANDPLPVKPFGKPIRRAMEYESLARDSDDRVTAEIYRQHADHWHRVARGESL